MPKYMQRFSYKDIYDKLKLAFTSLQKRSPEVFHRKTVLKISAIFTGNHRGWSLSLIKLQAFRLATLKGSSNTGVSL